MDIEVINLSKNYGKMALFSNLNMKLESGRTICIHGVSGCGKTTIINIIGQIEPYDEGDILFDGKKINGRNRRKFLQNSVGFIFQDYGLIENETVEENFLIVKKIRKMKNRKEMISKALCNVNLDESFLKRKVYELSGGEQQRVTIAKTLLKNPDIILADEPTASLDEENKQIVLDFLKQCAANGKTVVIVSHDPMIMAYADERIDLKALKDK